MAHGLLPFDFAKEIEVSEHAQIPSTSNGELNKVFPEDRGVHEWYRFVLSFPFHPRIRIGTGRFGSAPKVQPRGRLRTTMREYHFNCGNSTRGAVGLCGIVRARNRTEALRTVRRVLGELAGQCGEIGLQPPDGSIAYVNVYVSPENVRPADIECVRWGRSQ